ncbi:MAG TPA: hypothetical protein VMV56_02195 [Williamwhitmania sp.]|nr:hypothetical protein [Williamwhitmania sp.]
MKQITLLLICTAMLLAGCKKPNPAGNTVLGWWTPYYFMPEQLNGKVKLVKEQNYWASIVDGKLVKGKLISPTDRINLGWTDDFDVLFDENGQVQKSDYTDNNGLLIGSWVITLENGIPALANWIVRDSTTMTVLIKNDDRGNMVENQFFKGTSNQLLYRTDWVYNANKEFIKAIWYDNNGKLTKSNRYTWNSNHCVTDVEAYSANDSLKGRFKIVYNNKGFSKKQERFNADNNKLKSVNIEYEYDKIGNWTKATFYEDEKPVAIAERSYIYY